MISPIQYSVIVMSFKNVVSHRRYKQHTLACVKQAGLILQLAKLTEAAFLQRANHSDILIRTACNKEKLHKDFDICLSANSQTTERILI